MSRNTKKRPGPPQSGLAYNISTRRHSGQNASPRKDTLEMQSYEILRGGGALSRGRVVDLPASRGFGLPPIPGRSLWAVIVLTCVHCGSGHVHRSGDASMVLSGKLVRRCPATRMRYRLGPVQRRNEARRLTVARVA